MNFNLTENLALSEATLKVLIELLIVLGIGLVIGLEREYSKAVRSESQKHHELFAGVRTFPVVALIGYLAIYLNGVFASWIFPVVLLGLIGFVVTAYFTNTRRHIEGSTTEFALIAVFLLSALVYHGEYLLSAFIGLLIAVLLTFKVSMHRAVAKLDRKDLLSILIFVAITALILPLLPDKNYGPYGALNPFKIWSIVSIFIALNFIAYFLHKFIPSRYSILTTGVLGGFVSSTATAWYFSRQGGKSDNGGMTHVGAIVIASSIMFPRLLIWLFVLNTALLADIWIPIMIFGALGFGLGFYLSKKSLGKEDTGERDIQNPINIKDASIFAVLYVLILLLVGYAEQQLGSSGVYYAAGISGLTDVDAITISMADYAGDSVSLTTASIAILIAAFSNTIIKYGLCLVFGNNTIRKYASLAYVPLFVAGIAYITYLLLR